MERQADLRRLEPQGQPNADMAIAAMIRVAEHGLGQARILEHCFRRDPLIA
jgi:hypothetical protein